MIEDPGPAPPPAPKRKPRKLTLAAALKQAERAGQPVRSAEIYSDHVTLKFGQPEAAPPSLTPQEPINPWDAIYNATQQERPS